MIVIDIQQIIHSLCYIYTGAEVSTVTVDTSRVCNHRLDNSDLVFTGDDGSPLSVLGK